MTRCISQVTESMLSQETRERELRPLRMIPDNYEKIVLSMDRDFIKSYDGIKLQYLLDWLLAENDISLCGSSFGEGNCVFFNIYRKRLEWHFFCRANLE